LLLLLPILPHAAASCLNLLPKVRWQTQLSPRAWAAAQSGLHDGVMKGGREEGRRRMTELFQHTMLKIATSRDYFTAPKVESWSQDQHKLPSSELSCVFIIFWFRADI
jgi:hypothetical protein